jgi:hypothetical protein
VNISHVNLNLKCVANETYCLLRTVLTKAIPAVDPRKLADLYAAAPAAA